jgi:hypothetical protein
MGKSSRKKRSRRDQSAPDSGLETRLGLPAEARTSHGGEGPKSTRPALLLVLAGPALLGAAVYAVTLGNRLVDDDPGLFRYLRGLQGISDLFITAPPGESHPVLSYLSVYVERWIWGEWIPGFRITNVLLHALCSSLAALAALVVSGRRWVGLLAGLFFAVHPVHVEAVASIENRKDLLAMAFGASSLIFYQRLRGGVRRYLAASVCLVAALLSKAVAAVGLIIMLPAATLLLGSAGRQRGPHGLRRVLLLALPAGVLCLGIATVFTGPLQSFFTPRSIYMQTEGLCRSYSDVLTHAAGAVPESLRLLVYPARLNADYEAPSARRTREKRAGLGVGIAAIAIVAFTWTARFAPAVAFALLWTMVMYIPVSNLLPVGHFFVAERYLYMPSFGICLLLALILDRLARVQNKRYRARVWVAAITCAIVLAAAVRTVNRALDWRNTLTFWSANVKGGTDASARANASLGLALFRNARPGEAVEYLEKATAMQPHVQAYRELLGRAREEAKHPPSSQ